jgi:zinc transport system permease protein
MNLELLQTTFTQRAILGALLLSLLTSLWGVFVVLRKQAFLSDAVAHASILGIALGLYLGIYPLYLAIVIAVIFAIALTYLRNRSIQTNDTLIGIIYSLFFALGLIVLSRTTGVKVDIDSYLFGSIFGISSEELFMLFLLLGGSALYFAKNFKQILYSTFDPENAYLQGINVKTNDYLINIFLSITVIAAIKAVGLIMLAALLLAPAATARSMAKRFSQVIPMAALISVVGSLTGLLVSLGFDLPAGASIVVVLSFIFLLSNIYNAYSHK